MPPARFRRHSPSYVRLLPTSIPSKRSLYIAKAATAASSPVASSKPMASKPSSTYSAASIPGPPPISPSRSTKQTLPDSTDPLRAIIVGGGFSGTLVAIHLLRQPGCVHIDLIDQRIPGRGLAYSTVWDDHLLNVPAIRMSVFGSEPMHFLDWLHSNGKPDADAGSFAPRNLYGAYLQDVLETSI